MSHSKVVFGRYDRNAQIFEAFGAAHVLWIVVELAAPLLGIGRRPELIGLRSLTHSLTHSGGGVGGDGGRGQKGGQGDRGVSDQGGGGVGGGGGGGHHGEGVDEDKD